MVLLGLYDQSHRLGQLKGIVFPSENDYVFLIPCKIKKCFEAKTFNAKFYQILNSIQPKFNNHQGLSLKRLKMKPWPQSVWGPDHPQPPTTALGCPQPPSVALNRK
jgi:hypothetical protein